MKKNESKNRVTITSIHSKKILASLAIGALVLVPNALYYSYEYQGELWAPAYVQSEDLEVGEDGNLYYYLEPGKHTIEISRNDAFRHEVEKVEGYEIRSVEVTGWRHNHTVVYVNTKPVRVKLTDSDDVFSYFDEFGTVIEEEEFQKILEKRVH